MAWLDPLFEKMVELGASDLHLTSTKAPLLRIDGSMQPLPASTPIQPDELLRVLLEITPGLNQKEYEADGDTDFAYELRGAGRFRANLFRDRLGPGGVFRLIPSRMPTAEQLGLPKVVTELCYLSKGLVLVTGPTGSGKSTTLAAMIDTINRTRSDHIITIEDPIEFVHESKRCLINQREVGRHTQGFKRALRAALREDPDIVLVGEMRDLETVEIAIETAETGHLVFGTLHTTTAPSTVDRIIDQFAADRQAQIRTMLAASLKGVIAQTLCKKKPKGRVAALEIMIVTPAVASNVREGKTHQIPSLMQMGAKYGMRLLNDALFDLVRSDAVDALEAYTKAVNKEDMLTKLRSLGVELDLSSQGEPENDESAAPCVPEPRPESAAAPASPPSPLPSRSAAPRSEPGSPVAPRGAYVDPFEQFKKRKP